MNDYIFIDLNSIISQLYKTWYSLIEEWLIAIGPDEQLSDEDNALNQAIIDAAKLDNKEHADLAVESILISNNSPNIESTTHHLNVEEKTQETLDSFNDVSTVSTLIVSERKYSGTESVQINEKLIQREN